MAMNLKLIVLMVTAMRGNKPDAQDALHPELFQTGLEVVQGLG